MCEWPSEATLQESVLSFLPCEGPRDWTRIVSLWGRDPHWLTHLTKPRSVVTLELAHHFCSLASWCGREFLTGTLFLDLGDSNSRESKHAVPYDTYDILGQATIFYSTLLRLGQYCIAGCFQNILNDYMKARIGKLDQLFAVEILASRKFCWLRDSQIHL